MPGLGRPGNASVRSQEIKRRMRTRFTWIGAMLVLVAIGFLMACSTKYKPSSNGLIVVPTQGSAVMQTFSLNLGNGHVSQINNTSGPPIPGLPGAVILDPTGAFAYVVVNQNATLPGSATGVVSFKIGSDGKLAAGTMSPTLNSTGPTTANITCTTSTNVQDTFAVSVQPAPVVPHALAIDSAGKYLFVADVVTSGQTLPYLNPCTNVTETATVPVPGAVTVFSVSSGSLTEIAGSPFALPNEAGGTAGSASALAVTPTAFPIEFAACSGHAAPTTENLYVTDSANNIVLNYTVASDGTLAAVPTATTPGVSPGTTPPGVAVDPCGQFVYVANSVSNTVSAFTICTAGSQNCLPGDYSLQPVLSLPFTLCETPG